ncbi:transposase family protein [Mycobacterium sp. UM_CSW]|uniref:transposase family protein n=1 Tax=Mycobacterium sp. UM_CSW TaxID=1370119 RepID=UPI00041DED70|nr:transposase family protein [Mycobacterium sp. UM_CSW]
MQPLYAMAAQRLPPLLGRPSALPLAVRVLLVLAHLRTNLTTRALAALFYTSQSRVDRVIHYLVRCCPRVTAHSDRRHRAVDHHGPLIPVHDQSITAVSKNYRRSVNHPDHHLCSPAPRAGSQSLLAR